MTTTDPVARAIPSRPDSLRRRAAERVRPLALTALVASAIVTGLSIVWLVDPAISPFARPATPSLATLLLDPTAAAILSLAIGAAGIVLGTVLAARRRGSRQPSIAAGAGASALAIAFAFTFGSMSGIAITGYLFGAAAVVAGLVTIAVALVRAPRLGTALLAGLLLLIAVSVWWAGLTLEGLAGFAVGVGGALAAGLPGFAVVGLGMTCALVWAAAAIVTLRSTGSGRVAAWLVRHRRVLTVLAAIGPLPYAVARASWLTPWPLFGPSNAHLEPATLTTGLVIGAGAAAASLLTLGLILPWGRVFPGWMPRVGGRPVPVGVAAVPGFIAAGILCIAAVPMLLTTVGPVDAPADALLVNLVLPFWFWGPMLGLAVAAYVEWRALDREP
ncbi:hypothetical protein BJY17_001538 [Agromyces hippuratus]|uniref:Uncharacterized protein n=1 Tax=Agromyces hippuratus TaxID=286438 RepID=A0A852X412_9MICO|nr:hypothetical protein [Agromyces hippuratus]NYG20791.1 hypothetical protein [Agromyces hippuratus]